ncbi:MAG: dihydroneopterin aldolase [Rhodobacterales bacterium CG_4_10_14_0_8_um_filter_70_9]|nr:MAG: dihydroneopterin aldolase [Rhodobacterales bacterium CG_4_10_14_0_8_um_filter_70_9]PJA60114.1 MAG: dihydroneopterin aldolase [Rhodobacterales bacterium CG_4_9_14_3_um_filter_71_31]
MTDAEGDRIAVANLALYARHGVFDAEATLGQRFYLDLTAWLDLRPAGEADAVARTVDYGALIATASAAFAPRRKLIEAAAEAVAGAVLAAHPAVGRIEVTVRKPSAPVEAQVDHVSVTIIRRRGAP